MKNLKRIGVFLAIVLVLCSLLSLTVIAADAADAPNAEQSQSDGKLDMDLKPESFGERLELAVQGTATGLLMIFAVLTLLTLILYGSKYVFYDIPNKNKERAREVEREASIIADQPTLVQPQPDTAPAEAAVAAQDDGELAAVITAAIAAMLESEEYKNEFVGGFRVVSFKRSTQGAWNKK